MSQRFNCLALLAAIGALGFAACGGSSAIEPDAGLVASEGHGVACAGADADAMKAWNQLAHVRAAAGLGPVDCDDALQKAARAHAAYRTMNPSSDWHGETPGKPGFTGVDGSARARAAGFTGQITLEVIGDFDLMLGSVYHRLPFLAWNSGKYGYAAEIWDFAAGGTKPAVPAVTWPSDGAIDVITRFLPLAEGPNPIPEATGYVGYPISLHATGTLVLTSATLTGPSGAVDAYVITAATDHTGFIENEAFLVAKAQLLPATAYTAVFLGSVDGLALNQTVHFTTK